MTPSQDDDQLADSPDGIDEEPSRSLFRARWFRVVLVFLGIAAIAAVALPYVIDHVSPPRKPPAVAKSAPPSVPQPVAPPPAAPAPAVTPPAVQPPATTMPPVAPASPANQGAPTAAPRGTPSAGAGAPAATKSAPVMTSEKAKPSESAPSSRAKTIAKPSESGAGEYWVQVGAFRNPETAKRLAASLRQQSFNVSESTTDAGTTEAASAAPPKTSRAPAASSSIDRYDVHVTGSSVADLSARLGAKGLSVEPSGDGVVVRPSLPLRDAVALSKDLATDGLKVQVKRARGADAPASVSPAPGAAAPPASTEALHRVRVGAFADRAAAQAAARELEAKGFKPFIARGRQ